jgi:transcriptional regulator with XRE-family HTH domain
MERYDLFHSTGVLLSYVAPWEHGENEHIVETLNYKAVDVTIPDDYKPIATGTYWITTARQLKAYKKRYGVRPKPSTVDKLIKEFELKYK